MLFYLENIKDSALVAQIDKKLEERGISKTNKLNDIFGLKPRLGVGDYGMLKEIDKSKLSEEGLSEYEYMMKTFEKETENLNKCTKYTATGMYGLLSGFCGYVWGKILSKNKYVGIASAIISALGVGGAMYLIQDKKPIP